MADKHIKIGDLRLSTAHQDAGCYKMLTDEYVTHRIKTADASIADVAKGQNILSRIACRDFYSIVGSLNVKDRKDLLAQENDENAIRAIVAEGRKMGQSDLNEEDLTVIRKVIKKGVHLENVRNELVSFHW